MVSVGKEYRQTVQCTVCKKLIHKWCSGVRGDLSQVADGFRCRRCDGTIQEVDLAEDVSAHHIDYFFWLFGSQVLTRCPPLFVVHGSQAVVESRSSREIDNIPQI